VLTFTEKSLGRQLFGRLRKRCEVNVTVEIKKVGCDVRKWMELVVLSHQALVPVVVICKMVVID
jgi:archaellum biogenesis ATPase FlaH